MEFSSGYRAMMNCELLLMIGTDFAYQQFFPKDATIAQIDIRGVQLGRRTNVDYVPVGDTKPTLQALLPKLEQHSDEPHLKSSLELHASGLRGRSPNYQELWQHQRRQSAKVIPIVVLWSTGMIVRAGREWFSILNFDVMVWQRFPAD